MLNQSFRQVFVPKIGTSLLADGATVETIVPGQLGILDGNTYVSETAPTYATNKAIQLVLGTPDVSHLPLMAGIPQTNEYTKLIKGKLLKKIRRRTPEVGQAEIIAIGYDGTDTTKTLFAKTGDVKKVFIKATGNPIDKLYSEEGFQRQYWLEIPCSNNDCSQADACTDVDPEVLADLLVQKVNEDPKWNAGNNNARLVVATKVTGVDGAGKKVAGVTLQTGFINRLTNECTHDYFPYEADTVHLEVSEMNHDYNGNPCEARFPVTTVQELKYPTGVGYAVREQEKKSLGYFLKNYSQDPAIREAEGYVLNTDVTKTYVEYTLEYDFKYKVLGWSQDYTDSHHVVVFLESGSALATAFETAITGYATSIGSDVEVELA
jgi:hypothetical protein